MVICWVSARPSVSSSRKYVPLNRIESASLDSKAYSAPSPPFRADFITQAMCARKA